MRNGARFGSLATLSPHTITRISVDLGSGAGIAAVASGLNAGGSLDVILRVILGIMGGFVAFYIVKKLLQWLVVTAGDPSPRGALWRAIRRHPWLSLFALTSFLEALTILPLVVLSIWACLRTERRVRASPYRWEKYATDVLVAAMTALELLFRYDPDLLATQPAAGLFFAVGAWFSIRVWRAMARSRRFPVRAGADIVLSLLVGADLVLMVVWAANLLDLPEAEIAVLRGTLERVGSVADVPWPLWVGLYVLLAGTSLACALWPERLTTITQWLQRCHVVPSVEVGRRVLSGVHIALLVTVLIGLTAPASLEAALRGPLKARYTVALQRELESRAELAAYEEIRHQLSTGTRTGISPSVQPLVAIVRKIHNISGPSPGTSDATSTERDLAKRLGQLQATTLRLAPTDSALSTPPAVTELARFDPPIRDTGDVDDRLHRLDTRQRSADTVTRRLNQAAELAATAVANMIQIPGLGENEILQILREYLSGLVESSPLKEVFAAWAERLANAVIPPRADTMIVPDPDHLKLVALATLTEEKNRVQLADPSTPDQAQARARTESAADAAVDFVNEARYLHEHTGPCEGCPRPLPPGDEHYRGPDDYRVRPVGPVRPVEPPRIRIPFW